MKLLLRIELTKSIQDASFDLLKQAIIVRWLSLSRLLKFVDLSYEQVRLILLKTANNKQSLKSNKINIDELKDSYRYSKMRLFSYKLDTIGHSIWFI